MKFNREQNFEEMASTSARSSLEAMLDTIRRRDEQPKDLPPALPTRPISRGRLPSTRRSLPVNFALKSNGNDMNLASPERGVELKEEIGLKGGFFARVEKSSDIMMPTPESYRKRKEEDKAMDHKCTSASFAVNQKLKAWCWLPEGQWECGKIQSASVNDAHVLMPSGEVCILCNAMYCCDLRYRSLPKFWLHILRLPIENIWPANPEVHDDMYDMALLSFINEPSILHILKYRYSQNMIYSKAGPVLVALNPFKELPLQESKSVSVCHQQVGDIPHVFAAMDQAFNDILTGEKNQSIIISGESCSGKTKILKIAIQHLLAIGTGDEIDFKALKVNALLESFGNAKTLSNDSSSRFGKLNEIHLNQTGKICCARIKTFLLEKSRIFQRAMGERSFHVFYQVCAGAFPCIKAVENAANLLGCDLNVLVLTVSTQLNHSRNEAVVQKLTLSQINKTLQAGRTYRGSSLSILDTCGFEFYNKNGSSQLCRNYANERMEQHLISYLLKHERELAMPETARVSRQHGIVCIQKYIRGARARHVFKDVKNGVTTLQSFIRAERARNEFHHLTRQLRSAVLIQKHVKRWISVNAYAKQQKHLMLLQSVIRGCLARKHFSISRNLEMTECKHLNLDGDQIKWLYELKISDVIELKNGVLKVEAELKRKEEENSSLRQQLQQHENRWADYYGKMKSLEETWEKQITSLKMSLAAAKRSLATNNVASIAGRPDASPNIRFFDSEDAMSVENYTTEGTPATRPCASGAGLNRTSDGLRNTIGHLVKEFEERRHIFEDEAGFLVDVKSGKSISNLNPDEELSKLKAQFVSWKKNFKVRLLETKLALQKHGNPETRKMRRKWWGNWSSK